MAVADHHAGHPIGWRSGPILDAAQETQATIGNRFAVGAELRKPQGAVAGFRPGDRQHALMNASPCVWLGAALGRRQDDADACLARRRQQLLCVSLSDRRLWHQLGRTRGNPRRGRWLGHTPLLRKAEPGLVCRLQVLALQSLHGGQEAVCLDAGFGLPAGCYQQARDGWHPPQSSRRKSRLKHSRLRLAARVGRPRCGFGIEVKFIRLKLIRADFIMRQAPVEPFLRPIDPAA